MIKGIESITLFSQNPEKLAEFYKEKVGLKLTLEAEMGEEGEEEKIFGFDFKSGPSLVIAHHSKVKGENVQPERVIFNLEVDDIEKEAKSLKNAQVQLVEDIYHVENYGLIAPFQDIDGNYFQLVQVRAI